MSESTGTHGSGPRVVVNLCSLVSDAAALRHGQLIRGGCLRGVGGGVEATLWLLVFLGCSLIVAGDSPAGCGLPVAYVWLVWLQKTRAPLPGFRLAPAVFVHPDQMPTEMLKRKEKQNRPGLGRVTLPAPAVQLCYVFAAVTTNNR